MKLNYIVRDFSKIEFLTMKSNIQLELDLSEKVNYNHKFVIGNSYQQGCLQLAIINLFAETSEYRGNNIKILTKANNSEEILEILSSGSSLDEGILKTINDNYQIGSTLEMRPPYGGSKIIGFYAGKINGHVSIENTQDELYTVKNSLILKKID